MTTVSNNGATPGVVGLPKLFLRIEALTLLVGSAWGYTAVHGNGWLFAALFLAPDAAMLGYRLNRKVGAVIYNLAHTSALYGTMGALGYLTDHMLILQVGLIGLAHVGFDRLAGYGLKYPEAFESTHLGRIGRSAK